jgi:hypothetical protein
MITRPGVYYYFMFFIAIVAGLESQNHMNHMWPQLSNFAVLCLWELAIATVRNSIAKQHPYGQRAAWWGDSSPYSTMTSAQKLACQVHSLHPTIHR